MEKSEKEMWRGFFLLIAPPKCAVDSHAQSQVGPTVVIGVNIDISKHSVVNDVCSLPRLLPGLVSWHGGSQD